MPPTQPRQRRTGSAAFLPLVVAVCAILVVRLALDALFPSLSLWISFVGALVVGWVAYTLTERWLDRRGDAS
jgi:hypothetical protein